ncbi:MAG: peptidylprolyl isomerase [Verrucomicrobiaceae bacterium]
MPRSNAFPTALIALTGVLLGAGIVWKAMHEPAIDAHAPFGEAARREFERHKRQFQTSADYQARLTAQRLDEPALKQRIATAIETENRLEAAMPQVSESEVKAWYDVHRDSLRIPEAWHAAHVFLTRHDKAKPDRFAEIQAIHRRLAAGEVPFPAAAAQFSEDDRTKKLQGDLGWFTRDRMPEAFITAVAKLKPGELSKPVLSPLGWHVIRLIEHRSARTPSFDEARAEIIALLDLQKRQQALPLNQ